MRTIAFWVWFVVAVGALGRLWSTVESGGLFVRFGAVDAGALALLLASGLALGRAQVRVARDSRHID